MQLQIQTVQQYKQKAKWTAIEEDNLNASITNENSEKSGQTYNGWQQC